MKNLKRLIAVLLSCTLVIGSTLPSLAAESDVTQKISESKIVEQLKVDLGEEKVEEILQSTLSSKESIVVNENESNKELNEESSIELIDDTVKDVVEEPKGDLESNESNTDEKPNDSLELESETGESEIVETTVENNSELEIEITKSNEKAKSIEEIERNEIAYEVTENVDKSNGAVKNKIEKVESNSICEEETKESTSDDENTYVEMYDEIIASDFGTNAVATESNIEEILETEDTNINELSETIATISNIIENENTTYNEIIFGTTEPYEYNFITFPSSNNLDGITSQQITKYTFIKTDDDVEGTRFVAGRRFEGRNEFNIYGYLNGTEITVKIPTNAVLKGIGGISYGGPSGTKLFGGFSSLEEIVGINLLDVSDVTNMKGIFSGCSSLTSINSSTWGWDTSNVKDMSYMFSGCTSLTSVNISSFSTLNVENFSSMYIDCENLQLVNMENLNTSKVKNMWRMFYNCSSLTEFICNGWDISSVENMSEMFSKCISLENLDLSSFSNNNCSTFKYMFWECSALRNLNISNLRTNNAKNMYGMFCLTGFISGYSGYITNLESLDVSSFDVSNVIDMGSMFHGCDRLLTLDLSNFITSKVCCFESMFHNCRSLTSLDISNFDTSCVDFNSTEEGIPYKGSLAYMFGDCWRLTSLNVSNFNTEKVNSIGGMFSNCKSLTNLDITNFDTKNVTRMAHLFWGCEGLTEINLNNFDTRKVTDMSGMFASCSSLSELNLASFDTGNVTDMSSMFNGCTEVNRIKVSDNFVTAQVENSSNMFGYNFDGRGAAGCVALIGGNGTAFSYNYIDKEYARIDKSGALGYFTEGDIGNLISATIDTLPTKTTYFVGEKFNPTGTKILAIYDSGIRKLISYTETNKGMWSFVPSINTNLSTSDTSIEIIFNGLSCGNVEIKIKELTRITIATNPTRLDYASGQSLNPTGLVLTLNYTTYAVSGNTNSTEKVAYNSSTQNKFTFNPSGALTSSENITIIYDGKTGTNLNPTFAITVYQVASISVVNVPSTTSYNAGSKLNPNGLIIKVNKVGGTSDNIIYSSSNSSDFTFNPSLSTNLNTGNKSVTVTYGGKSTTFAISVIKNSGGNVPPSGGGGSSGGGGGGGGGALPANIPNSAPNSTTVAGSKTISATLDATNVNWAVDPTTGKWILGATINGQSTLVSNGFFQINSTATQIVNGVQVQVPTNNTYYFDATGAMVTGWIQTSDSKWYFFENAKTADEGKMQIGWKQVQGSWYFFGADGAMYENQVTPDGHVVGADGRWVQV